MTQYSYEIGTSSSTTNVESLTVAVPPPKSKFQLYSKMLDLGNGTVRGAGWTIAEWNFGYLERSQRDQLRQFCTGASATVYINTKTMDTTDTYKKYQCTVVWPIETEQRDSRGTRPDFVLKFRAMVEVSP